MSLREGAASRLIAELLTEYDDEIVGSSHRSLVDRQTTVDMSIDIDALREYGIVDDDGNLQLDEHQAHATFFESGIAILDLQSAVDELDDERAGD